MSLGPVGGPGRLLLRVSVLQQTIGPLKPLSQAVLELILPEGCRRPEAGRFSRNPSDPERFIVTAAVNAVVALGRGLAVCSQLRGSVIPSDRR